MVKIYLHTLFAREGSIEIPSVAHGLVLMLVLPKTPRYSIKVVKNNQSIFYVFYREYNIFHFNYDVLNSRKRNNKNMNKNISYETIITSAAFRRLTGLVKLS